MSLIRYCDMRYISSLFTLTGLVAILLFTACSKDEPSNPPAGATFQGEFVSGAHGTSGTASIDSAATTLTLTNFKTSSGPDVNIYLARSLNTITSDYIDLGDNKGLNGTYTYTVPGGTDFLSYKYVVVWCVDFNVNFGYAELVKQ